MSAEAGFNTPPRRPAETFVEKRIEEIAVAIKSPKALIRKFQGSLGTFARNCYSVANGKRTPFTKSADTLKGVWKSIDDEGFTSQVVEQGAVKIKRATGNKGLKDSIAFTLAETTSEKGRRDRRERVTALRAEMQYALSSAMSSHYETAGPRLATGRALLAQKENILSIWASDVEVLNKIEPGKVPIVEDVRRQFVVLEGALEELERVTHTKTESPDALLAATRAIKAIATEIDIVVHGAVDHAESTYKERIRDTLDPSKAPLDQDGVIKNERVLDFAVEVSAPSAGYATLSQFSKDFTNFATQIESDIKRLAKTKTFRDTNERNLKLFEEGDGLQSSRERLMEEAAAKQRELATKREAFSTFRNELRNLLLPITSGKKNPVVSHQEVLTLINRQAPVEVKEKLVALCGKAVGRTKTNLKKTAGVKLTQATTRVADQLEQAEKVLGLIAGTTPQAA